MKLINYRDSIPKLLKAFLLNCILLSSYAFAATGYTLSANSTTTILEHSVCITLSNTSLASYFVPTGTSADWAAFLNHLPQGVATSACGATCNKSLTVTGEPAPQSFSVTKSGNVLTVSFNCWATTTTFTYGVAETKNPTLNWNPGCGGGATGYPQIIYDGANTFTAHSVFVQWWTYAAWYDWGTAYVLPEITYTDTWSDGCASQSGPIKAGPTCTDTADRTISGNLVTRPCWNYQSVY